MSSVTKETQQCLLFSIVVEIKKIVLFISTGLSLKVYTISLEESVFILIWCHRRQFHPLVHVKHRTFFSDFHQSLDVLGRFS